MKKSLLLALWITLPFFSALAQVPVNLPVSIGQKTDQNTGTSYSISSSGQPAENLQELRLLLIHATASEGATKTTTSAITLRTGRQKTVAQLSTMLAEVLQKFAAGAAPGAVLGTLGSLDKGGAVDFIAESADSLRFDFKTPHAPASSSYLTRADAEMFASLLKP